MKINAILLKPLDGDAPGSPRSFDKGDFDRLKAMGAVREAGETDALPPERDANAELLEQLRHPVAGPLVLAQMRGAFEDIERARDRLAKELDARDGAYLERDSAIAARADAEQARDAAYLERDGANAARGEAEAARADAQAGNSEGTDVTKVPAKTSDRGAKGSREA